MNDHANGSAKATGNGNDSLKDSSFVVGRWLADAKACTLTCGASTTKLSPRAMDVLVYLAERAASTVKHDELLVDFWRGSASSPKAIHKVIAELRQALIDDGTFIETVPKRGYRLLAAVARREAAANESELTIVSFNSRNALVRPIKPKGLSLNATTFAERIQREFMAQLGQMANASVRTQKMSLEQTRRPTIAAELGLDYTVDFDVHEVDGRAHATVALLPTSNEMPTHQELFDSSTALHDKITHLLDCLVVLLDVDHVERMRERGTRNVDAYRDVVEAEVFQRGKSFASVRQAEALFKSAIEKDPRFARAYRRLAGSYRDLAMMANSTPTRENVRRQLQDLLDKAKTWRHCAESIHCIEQQYRCASQVNPFDAESLWRAEIVKDPFNAHALRRYGDLLVGAKLVDESETFLERAIALTTRNIETGFKMIAARSPERAATLNRRLSGRSETSNAFLTLRFSWSDWCATWQSCGDTPNPSSTSVAWMPPTPRGHFMQG